MANKNPFRLSDSESITPARAHYQIVPSDTEKLPTQPKAIYCQEAGTIVLVDENNVALPYAMSAGQTLLLRATQAKATGTTGTFYGLY
ncbi:spike base protein, RCAP_Rcc01079 family [Rhizobium wenxiniae]|uniref:spike base protein, RCAP_Rcc01079 family n=1 Tax=Rhizobium wenxiniae TaxID=1737357 RepID=UPI003C13059C